jgi:RND family efflux transporter MFP subunit
MSLRSYARSFVILTVLAGIGLAAVALSSNRRESQPATLAPAASIPSVTVVRAEVREIADTALVNGTLVARDDIMVGPEIDGHRIVSLHADDGDRVVAGQVLARLSRDMIEVQREQNAAALARADAAIAQARSQIIQADATATEANNALERTRTLSRTGVASQENLDTRTANARTATARLAAARDGLALAQAERAQILALRREIDLRLERTEIKAPAAGVVSRRMARIGMIASPAGDALFRIIADGAIEFEAEVPEHRIAAIAPGQLVRVSVAGGALFEGRVRLVNAEVERGTRLAKIRIALPSNANLHIGQFARGSVDIAWRRGVVLPMSAIVYANDGNSVLRVREGRVEARKVRLGIVADGVVEVLDGIDDGDRVVSRAGSFLRDGDLVVPVEGAPRS